MSQASASALTGSLQVIMNNLVDLERRVSESVNDELRVYMWRPRQPDLPCVWNWIAGAPFEQRDLGRHRDNLLINSYISIRHTDEQQEMDTLMRYVDAFRDVVDRELFAQRPLGGQRAMRSGLSMMEERFNDVPTLSVQLPIVVQVDRMIYAS